MSIAIRSSAVCLTLATIACTDMTAPEDETTSATYQATTINTPVGLALDIDNGVAKTLRVRKNQRAYINQIDMRASVLGSVDRGVAGLDASGDFAQLLWQGTKLADESFASTPNADGTWTRRRFFREALWMDLPSAFIIQQLDAAGHVVGFPYWVTTGLEHHRLAGDDFFDRRLRAIQWTTDCVSQTDCTGAHAASARAPRSAGALMNAGRTLSKTRAEVKNKPRTPMPAP